MPIRKLDTRKKVALVGFHPYSTATVGNKLDGWIDTPCKSQISQKYGTDLKSAFFKGRRNVPSDHRAAYPLRNQLVHPLSWGEPIGKFPTSGVESGIEEENISRFMEFSYSLLGAGALPDLCEVLEWDSGSKTFQLKKRNVDYYVVGIFTPVFSEPTVLGAITFAITFPLSFLTVGILPMAMEKRTESYFRVYDPKLNLVKEIKASNSFWRLDAIWAMPSDRSRVVEKYSYDPPAWEKDVAEMDKTWKPE
ncbi:hypothetical protein LEP1GSC058_4148 [Leptospira fainei serovar Hurstbridge str. BUT 6]|uniref:Uncharacterized protein n=2 Tax=Leptospira fainei TaxID=48782 RepID=S3UXY7_9LEPT|nr:hypothetical protein [Leptospira fainei]EPG74078.1 hypothetical protein LEP1GSC058_4148 [Leptospira fainei serovar Hurstbridge str. BUT 6]